MRTLELKSCPFCGGTPKLVSAETSYIICHTCGIRTASVYHEFPSQHEEMVSLHWNTRAESSEIKP